MHHVIFMSCLLAPTTDTLTGNPLPTTNILRLVPDLLLSVGFGPVLFPPRGALVMTPFIGCHFQSNVVFSSYTGKVYRN
jgi:hypothetical protein